jgi:fatty acid desaturase
MEKDTENNTGLLDPLLSLAVEYSKTVYALLKLKVLKKSSGTASTVLSLALILFVFSVFLLFINLGLAIWLGYLLGKIYLGFFIVAGFYLIVGLVLHFVFHRKLKRLFSNHIINQVLNQPGA